MSSRYATALALVCSTTSIDATTLSNPAISPGNIAHWASEVIEHSPGPQNINDPTSADANGGDPANALGQADSSTVSLGDGGSITVSFADPMTNQGGVDFAVFENAFSFEGLVFAELGFVSVSSNGSDFATFDPLFLDPTIDDSFGSNFRLIDVTQTNNFAGVHQSGSGTGFDLSELDDHPLIEQGLLDLDSVQFVRITDAIGDGSTLDSIGNAIFDPYPTALSVGGFDLDAVGVVKPIPIPASILLFAGALFWLRTNSAFPSKRA